MTTPTGSSGLEREMAPRIKNHLPDAAYRMPATWFGTMTTKQLRETLLATDGRVLACGELCDVIGKSLGAGVYRVTLRKAVLRE